MAFQAGTEMRRIVIDHGSSTLKAGAAGDDVPSYVKNEQDLKDYDVPFPIKRGAVTDWDALALTWRHMFCDIDDFECLALMVADAPLTSRADRERMVQVMFDVFELPAAYIQNAATLSLVCCGQISEAACVISSGGGVTTTVAVHKGYAVPDTTECLDVAGEDLTDFMVQMLTKRGKLNNTTPSQAHEIARDIKEKLAHVDEFRTHNFTQTQDYSDYQRGRTYTLPDGGTIQVGDELIRCAEALFEPSRVGRSGRGIGECGMETINKCDISFRHELFGNLVLAGGSTLFPGFATRTQHEIESRGPSGPKFSVNAIPERKDSAWMGGSILASLSTFPQCWITRDEFMEVGPSIVHSKCF
jgi:actin-related protein